MITNNRKSTRRSVLKSSALATLPIIGMGTNAVGTARAEDSTYRVEPYAVEAYEHEADLVDVPYGYDEAKQVTGIMTTYHGTRKASSAEFESFFRTVSNSTVLAREYGGEWEPLDVDQYFFDPDGFYMEKAHLGLALTKSYHIDDSGLEDAARSEWGTPTGTNDPGELLKEAVKVLLAQVPILGGVFDGIELADALAPGGTRLTNGRTEVEFEWQGPKESVATISYNFSVFHGDTRAIEFEIDSWFNIQPMNGGKQDHSYFATFDNYGDLRLPD